MCFSFSGRLEQARVIALSGVLYNVLTVSSLITYGVVVSTEVRFVDEVICARHMVGCGTLAFRERCMIG